MARTGEIALKIEQSSNRAMTHAPLVSVVTSVFNGRRYLRSSIESVLAQDGVDFEFIVIDDGSTDGSGTVLDEYAAGDSRVRILHQGNAGLTRALIRGCAEARGEFIARHDSDDVSLPGRLRAQADRLKADPRLTMVSCWTAAIGPENEELFETRRPDDPERATTGLRELWEGPPGHGSVTFRRETYVSVGGYRPEFRYAQDSDLWLRLVERGRIAYCPEVLYAYRIAANSISSGSRSLQTEFGRLAHECGDLRRRGETEKSILERAARLGETARVVERNRSGEGNYFLGSCLLKREDPRCRPYLRRALGLSPTGFKAAVGLVRSIGLGFGSAPAARSFAPRVAGSLRVLMVANVNPDPNSGASGTEVQTAAGLRRIGCTVDNVWAKDLRRHIRHENLFSLLDQPRSYRAAVRRKLEQDAYDVIHVNQPQSYLVAKDLRRRLPNTVVVHRSHGLESRVREVEKFWRRRWKMPRHRFPKSIVSNILRQLLDRQVRRAARYCDGTIVSSRADRDYLVSRFGVSEDRVAVIPQAPPDLYREAPIAARTARASPGVLYVGQFEFAKGSVLIIEVFRMLAQRNAEDRLTWVTSPGRFDDIREALGKEALRVRLVPHLDQEELRRIYDDHDVFIFPSLFEGFGKAFLEAMSRGLAVVASDEGGMRDVIRDGENGFLVPPGDSLGIVERVERLLTDAALRERISAAARATALEYSWDRVARETAAFYNRLIRLQESGSAVNPSQLGFSVGRDRS